MEPIHIHKQQARHFLIVHQGLHKRDAYGKGTDGILAFLAHVNSIQFDPLDIAGKSPELVLQARFSNMQRSTLQTLLYKERVLVDGFDKEMCVYQMEEWPNFHRIHKRMEERTRHVFAYRHMEAALSYEQEVLDFVNTHTICTPNQMDLGASEKSAWGNKKYASAWMDALSNSGKIAIYSRNHTQRTYAPLHLCYPKSILDTPEPFPDEHAFMLWYVKRRIRCIGLYWLKQGAGWQGYYLDKKIQRASIVQELVDKKELYEVQVEGCKDIFYIAKEDVDTLLHLPPISSNVRFLAPLDTLLWDRDLILELFGFHYRWEVYKPQKERIYGYYVLPVLYRDQLIARIEVGNSNPQLGLVIKGWWWEAGIHPTKQMKQAIQKEIQHYKKFITTK